MRYVERMSYEDMSKKLKTPLGSLKSNLFRAKNIFREKYTKIKNKTERVHR